MRGLAYALLLFSASCLSEPKPASQGGGDGGADDDGGNGDGGDGDAAGPPRVTQIATGFSHTCAVISDGRLRCWGKNDDGELGHGNSAANRQIGDNELPSSAGDVPVGGNVRQVVCGNSFTCALLEGGSVRCWGRNSSGQLGIGNVTPYGDDEPASDAPFVVLGAPAFSISAGGNHVCALLDAPGGDILCWGEGGGATSSGALGYGPDTDIIGSNVGDDELPNAIRPEGVPVSSLDITFVVAGFIHTCAVVSGSVFCWGEDFNHQLGYPDGNVRRGDDESANVAGTVTVGGTVSSLVGGQNHTCALLTDRSLRCWGSGVNGALGYGNPNDIGDAEQPSTAGPVPLNAEVRQVVGGAGTTCALLDKDQDEVRCWGNAASGRLGNGSPENIGDNEAVTSIPPVQLGGIPEALSISNGGALGHTCAILTTGDVRCWGNNSSGQLGYGNLDPVGDNELPDEVDPVEIL